MNPEIIIIGFPKCGTSALIRSLMEDPQIRVLRTPEGAIEVPWPLICDIRPEVERGTILAHKYTSYVYNRNSLEYLVKLNPNSFIVLCVRDPVKSLVSWHNMHRTIARTGRQKQHFAWKERDFYSECELTEYYEHFASRKLQYDQHLKATLKVVPKERLVVVSQERMAQDIHSVRLYLKALALGKVGSASTASAPDGDRSKHTGYADSIGIELDVTILNELHGVQKRLCEIISNDVVYKCI
ncbi:sulfotransferase domain-containing protein [Gilvimarinus sp. 1_MG-2023]|uniref:sulfotransferase domain-containing protein n=1 Tax=Gilvimarinus sp. 1_MG-2023 TaxID=3062638 RepID=UPI0026E208F3|nr:sulfotransferase domain-containing protein [Gilvimarinus sp. 1_MG-2023]MDO6746293.1 sulfotransferase domain-containing protein [Gilvimarinus sp. 1_MG-2023]